MDSPSDLDSVLLSVFDSLLELEELDELDSELLDDEELEEEDELLLDDELGAGLDVGADVVGELGMLDVALDAAPEAADAAELAADDAALLAV